MKIEVIQIWGGVILSNDISIVIQGAVDNTFVRRNVINIRKLFPNSEIIISTWEKSDVTFIDYDKVIFNKDPGADFYDKRKTMKLNINRILVSSKKGIAAAERKYVLKCRSDLEILSNDFLKEFDKYKKRNDDFVVAEHKIIVLSTFSLKFEKEKKYIHYTPFHISDWCCFGLKSDLERLFDVPLVNRKNYIRYFGTFPSKKSFEIEWMNERLWRYPPEQYITYNFARKKLDIKFEHCLDYENVPREISEQFIINNFIILDPDQFRVICRKEYYETITKHIWMQDDFTWIGCYRNYRYLEDYKKYCDSNMNLPIDMKGFLHIVFRFMIHIGIGLKTTEHIYCIFFDKLAYAISPLYREVRKTRRQIERL